MILNLQRHWYCRSLTWLTLLLLPFSYLFRLIVFLRLFFYKHQFIKTQHFPVPIIVIGNLTVGGTGKTPIVIWLADFLKTQNWRPGIISRGFGGSKQTTPFVVKEHSDPKVVGDEAILLVRKSECPVVICADRVAAAKKLLEITDCNVILSDDGLQHYRLARDIEIAVLDGDRQLGNGFLMPAGPLRESQARLNQVDFVIQQGGSENEKYYHMQVKGNELVSLANPKTHIPVAHFKNTSVHAVAGIGNPQRFFASLREQGLQIIEHVFPDHYLYEKKDFNFPDTLPIVMTEKDKVKCESWADERFWYLPVVATIDESFKKKLLFLLSRPR